MRAVEIRPGVRIRWVEVPGATPARVYLHGLGASSAPYYAEAVAHPLLAGRRSLMVDMLGFGISDRPSGFAYSLEGHADALAVSLMPKPSMSTIRLRRPASRGCATASA
jgi:pimeloyl-ACP methyl ester carboxylesterase